MKILLGSRMKDIGDKEFQNIVKGFKSLVVDIGTGEGEFIYKRALKNQDEMHIGVDTSVDSMCRYSMKSIKKPEKGGLRNVLYVVGDASNLPDVLSCTADRIFVNLPWGSLRDGIVKGEHSFLSSIRKISKENASLEMYFSYCDLYEKQEIEVRQLPELTIPYLSNVLKEKYRSYGIHFTHISILDNEGLKEIGTRWAKKLGFGKRREVYCVKCKIQK